MGLGPGAVLWARVPGKLAMSVPPSSSPPVAQASGLGGGSFGLRFCSGCRPKIQAIQEKSVGIGVFGGDRKGFHLGIIKVIQ